MALTLSRAAARRLLPRLTPSSMASSASASSPSGRLLLPDAVSRLDSLAPPALAESWDNVGLLLQPSAPKAVSKVMLTNDLTDPVLKEAVGLGVDLLVSYHPPVFKALKRVTQANWKERLVVTCLENRMAVYSPHTAYDVVENGVADWLISAFEGRVSVLAQRGELKHSGGLAYQLSVRGVGPQDVSSDASQPMQKLLGLTGIRLRFSDVDGGSVEVLCSQSRLLEATEALAGLVRGDKSEVLVVKLEKHFVEGRGLGRRVDLDNEITLRQAIEIAKKHCGLEKARVVVAEGKDLDSPVRSVSCCAGSGASVLSMGGSPPDHLWLTGEMSHHELLDASHAGVSVFLAEHSNSERGFLKDRLRKRVELVLNEGVSPGNKVEVVVSADDQDPVLIM